MYTILLCIFISCLLPFVAKAPLAYAMAKSGGYNNRLPREQQRSLTGFGARAKAAHENAFEALIVFAPCALAVVAVDAVSGYTETLAMVFVVARILYNLMYLLDWDKLRSSVWMVGIVCSMLMLWEAMAKVAA
ncbi:MAPEG family protein [Aliiglaciecola sp. CAU 1673]|uniref:MAPEG family protein n=1 Tax=Aliiglaciecola sp. CAU 1673 TaxID=3032595 RepID=UPI0023DC6F2E|nr:MAPEG family protein [Aliiglaciecola sp. CAU 1673]MDF2179519.1 MAPEG family protein [Aliiglaciecola sp. CAU 1673]